MSNSFAVSIGQGGGRQSRVIMLVISGIVALLNFHVSGMDPLSVTLDPSWCQVLDYAFGQKLRFGQDIVFTFGPYGFLYCDPSLGQHLLMRYASAWFLALVIGYLVVRTCSELKPWIGWTLLGWCALMLDVESRAYLVIGLGALNLLLFRDGLKAAIPVVTALALLSLIKFTFAVAAAVIVAVVVLTLVATQNRRAAIQVAVGYLTAVVTLWLLAGQPLMNLPVYARTSMDVAGGYSAAMGNLPFAGEFLIAVAALAGIFFLIVVSAVTGRVPERYGVILVLVVLVLVAWKRGFVRADFYHVPGFFLILPVASILALSKATALSDSAFSVAKRLYAILLLVALFGVLKVDVYYPGQQLDAIQRQLRLLISLPMSSIHAPVADQPPPSIKANSFTLALAQELGRVKSIDLISYEQGRLFVNRLKYQPRPIIQSYSAYTQSLAVLNATHFLSPARPDFVLFDPAETIDGRLPMMDDGAALLVVLGNYRALGRDGKYLLLQRRDDPPRPPDLELLSERELRWGENVDLAAFGSEVLAFSLEVTPSAAGRLAGLLFQSLPPQIVLDAGDGERRYRLVPGMLATPVLLSPQLRTADDLLALGAASGTGFASAVRKLRFEVAPPAPLLAGHEDFGRALYHDTLKLRLYRVRGLPDAAFTAGYRASAAPGP